MREDNREFAFCFKKAKGLRLISPNKNLVEVYKKKSRSALNMLSSAIEKGEDEWILDMDNCMTCITFYCSYTDRELL